MPGYMESSPEDHVMHDVAKTTVASNSDIWIVDGVTDCERLTVLLLSLPIIGYDLTCGSYGTSMPLKSKLIIPDGPHRIGNRDYLNKQSGAGLPLQGVGFYWHGGQGAYVPLCEPNLSIKLDALTKVLGSTCLEKVTIGVKKQMKILSSISGHQSVAIAHPVIDVRIAAWMRAPDSTKAMDHTYPC